MAEQQQPALIIEVVPVLTNGAIDEELTAASGCVAVIEGGVSTPEARARIVRYLQERYGQVAP